MDWDEEVFGPVATAFGRPVIYQPQQGLPYQIDDAIYEDAYEGLALTGDAPMATTEMATLEVRLADMLMPPQRNDKVTIVRTLDTFVVADVESDVNGRALLKLQFQGKRSR